MNTPRRMIVGVSGATGVVSAISDVGAAISSGSFRTMGMIIAPCSMRRVGRVLDLFDLDAGLVDRWTGDKPRDAAVLPLDHKVNP